MSLGLNAIAAAAAAVLLAGAGAASAQPYYGYGELPPPPYQEIGRSYAGGGCGGDRFTLLGAHAGVTVLGVDLDAGAGLSVPTGYCGDGGQVEQFEPRPYAPPPAPMAYAPPAYAYAPPAYAYQGYAAQSYQPPMPPPSYPAPCGCEPPRW